ncbi:MAG: PIN domain-containing protein [Candidatus Bathyarchaeota archaeon]|nr:PIN domain-containing protein [Candidatus Bathyarchaeota archaeon]
MLDCLTFDTEPIVAFFRGEPWARQVIDLLQKVQNKDAEGYINIFNLTEVYYTIARRELKAAEENQKLLRLYGLKIVPVEDNGLWREAALIKNKYHLSLGDSFAVVTAQATKSKLVVGSDKELNNLDVPLIKIRK